MTSCSLVNRRRSLAWLTGWLSKPIQSDAAFDCRKLSPAVWAGAGSGYWLQRLHFLLTRFEMFSLNQKEHSCLKDCFNPCICWLFSELPCLCSGRKSSPNLAKVEKTKKQACRDCGVKLLSFSALCLAPEVWHQTFSQPVKSSHSRTSYHSERTSGPRGICSFGRVTDQCIAPFFGWCSRSTYHLAIAFSQSSLPMLGRQGEAAVRRTNEQTSVVVSVNSHHISEAVILSGLQAT